MEKLRPAAPDKMFTMCGYGTGPGQQPLVSAPPSEQHWQKEQKGKATKAAELKRAFLDATCPATAAPSSPTETTITSPSVV